MCGILEVLSLYPWKLISSSGFEAQFTMKYVLNFKFCFLLCHLFHRPFLIQNFVWLQILAIQNFFRFLYLITYTQNLRPQGKTFIKTFFIKKKNILGCLGCKSFFYIVLVSGLPHKAALQKYNLRNSLSSLDAYIYCLYFVLHLAFCLGATRPQ